MNKSKYKINDSLEQTYSDDEFDQENEKQIDNQVDDEKILDQVQGDVTFTSFIKTTFKIENINKEIKIAISKFEFNQLKSLCSDLQINLHYAQEYIEVQSDKIEENEGDLLFLKQQVSSFFQQYSSIKLNFDVDDLRAIQTSNLLINELQKYQIYLIRMRSIDQKISLYLVSKAKNLMDVAKNLENRLRGIRIFFQDCVGYMTKLHKNRDFKECLTKLRLSHYQKILRQKIEQDFQSIVFHDILDKNNTFSSLIIGYNFPYQMQGKQDICQKLFRYISTQIQIQLALFIQFPNTQECLQLANKLVNITNDAKKTNFYCSSQVFLGVSSVGIIGHPKDLITLINDHLTPYCDDFDRSQEFIQGLKIGILEKNFCHTIGDQRITFDSIKNFLQRKPEIELNQQDQLKLIRIKERIRFKSYCNLLKFICEQKQKLSTEQTEAKLSLELEYISQKLILPENDLNFFEIIQNQIAFQHQNSQEKKQNNQQQQQNYKNQQNYNKNSDYQGNKGRNQDHPRNQNRNDDNQRNQYRNQDNQRNQNRNSDHPRNQNRNQDFPRNQDRNDDNQNNQDRNLDHQRNQNRNQDHPRNQNRNQNRNEDHPNNLVQSQNQSSAQSQKSTEDLNQLSNNSSQQEYYSNQDQEEQNNVNFLINRNEINKIYQQDQIFQSSIIKQLKEQNQRFVVSLEYKEYFQKLIGQDINLSVSYEQNEKMKSFFIFLDKDEIFKTKCFKKNIKIFEKLQDAKQFCLGEKNVKIIEVMVNQHAEKDNQIDEENKKNNSYFYTTQDNQIYPIRLKE